MSNHNDNHSKNSTTIINYTHNPLYHKISYQFYISKYIEFLDTFFLILMKRPISYLQFLHHLGAPFALGTLITTKNEILWIGIILNGFIHSIMYTYYSLCIKKI